jgi:anti-sigma F factor
MGDIKGEMNMYADDISVSETEVKGKLIKIKDSEDYRKFKQNEQRQAEKNGTWMHLEIDSHSSNEEFARVTAAVFMSRMNPTMEELEDVRTAVSDAVTNAVIHGYSDAIGIIYIESRIEGEQLIISVRDEAKGILDVEKAMGAMYTTDSTGERSGMGFSYIAAFMDDVLVESQVRCLTYGTM